MSAFRVVSARAGPSTRMELPLVGREQELTALSALLDRVCDGRGAIASITGEPGIGKSRLVAELEGRFAGRVRFLAGHAVSYAETIPYWPVRELLRAWLGLGVSDPEARVRLELRAELARTLADDAEEAYPFLATLLGLTLEPEQEQRLGEFARDAVQHQTFELALRARLRARTRSPAMSRARGPPLVGRSNALAARRAASGGRALRGRLPAHPSQRPRPPRLAARRPRPQAVPARVPRARAGAACGRETCAHSRKRPPRASCRTSSPSCSPSGRAATRTSSGRRFEICASAAPWSGSTGRVVLVGEASIPAAVQEALQARLDRLDADARELLTTAAVIGRSFGLAAARAAPPAGAAPADARRARVAPARGRGAERSRARVPLPARARAGGRLRDARRGAPTGAPPAGRRGARGAPPRLAGGGVRAARPPLRRGGRARARGRVPPEGGRRGPRGLRRGRGGRALPAGARLHGTDRRRGAARQTLLKIGLTHHLAFEYDAANEAFSEAFARPAPAPAQLEPGERITWAADDGLGHERSHRGTDSGQATQVTRNLFRGLVAIGHDLRHRARSRRALHRLRRRTDVPVHASTRRPVERRRARDGGRFRVHLRPDGRGRRGPAHSGSTG